MNDAADALKRGVMLQAAGRAREALDAFRAAAAAAPGSVEPWCRAAAAAEALSEWETAARCYDAAVRVSPKFAEAWCNYGGVLLTLGRHADAERAFRSALAAKPALAIALNGLGVALKAQGQLEGALEALQEAVRLAPNYGQAHFNLGNVFFARDRAVDAVAAFVKALELSPRDPAVLQNLSGALYSARDFEHAAHVARELLAIAPDRPEAHNALGNAELALGHFDAAEHSFRRALALRPNFVGAITNLGNTLLAQNRLAEALAEYERAAALDPTSAEARFNPAIPVLLGGDLKRGFALYEHRLATPERKPRRQYERPTWTGAEPIAGKTLFVHFEQGIGDTLQFARYVPLLTDRGARVILEIQPPVAALFAGWPNVVLLDPAEQNVPAHDFHISLLSLPHALGTDLSSVPANVPYLAATAAAAARWQAKLSAYPRPWVGLACSGNAKHQNDHNRSVPLGQLMPLREAVGAPLHLVQKDLKPSDAATAAANPATWIDWSRTLADFGDTAGLIQCLDVIVTVDTSLAHLAGALGRPVWVLLPFAPDWRWMLERTDSPWYPTARLYRQPASRVWSSVVEAVATDLRTLRK